MQNFKKHTKLQNLKKGEELAIFKGDFKAFKRVITFGDLVLAKRKRNISYADGKEQLPFELTHQIIGVDFYGYKGSYETLGLYLFQLLFSNESYIHIKLTQKQSQIKNLFLHLDRTVTNDFHLKTKPLIPQQYDYFRETIEKFPLSGSGFSDRKVPQEDCPSLLFGWSERSQSYHEDREKLADQLIISVSIDGLCALASVFLDMGAEENKKDEICLENPTLGFGGTGVNSLEARFWLPNSFGFYGENLDDLKL